MYAVEQRGFLFRKYWQTGSFKACQTAFRTEFGERRAPSNCCIQKLVKMLQTRGSRSNACRLLSLGSIEGQSVQKYTPHPKTLYAKRFQQSPSTFGERIPEFGETNSSVLGCERRPVSASIVSKFCFASFPVCVYKFSSHYLNNIIFIDNSLGTTASDSPCILRAVFLALGIQHAMIMCLVVMCGLPVSIIILHIISQRVGLREKCYWNKNMYFRFSKIFVWNTSDSMRKWGRYVKKSKLFFT